MGNIRSGLIAAGIAACTAMAAPAAVWADGILIVDADFSRFTESARAGDVLTIFPGTYLLSRSAKLKADGTADKPITLRPAIPGRVKILVEATVGFDVTGAHWILENLDVTGRCADHSVCEHAVHIAGDADGVILRNNKFVDFNAAIKGNGTAYDGIQRFPDNVLIEHNQIYNTGPRRTDNPVTPIDVVGGENWMIRDNFIADFEKGQGNRISYAAFLKGHSKNGTFERNLVICEWQHQGGVRLGLSFGGGGTTEPAFCGDMDCSIQHQSGLMISNVILNCPADVGVYLNSAANTRLINNTILNTRGVDVRFKGSSAMIANNVIEGRIKARDGGRYADEHNLVADSLAAEFPALATLDISPANANMLEGASPHYEAPDYCTGNPQHRWIGAISQPAACKLSDRTAAAPKDR